MTSESINKEYIKECIGDLRKSIDNLRIVSERKGVKKGFIAGCAVSTCVFGIVFITTRLSRH